MLYISISGLSLRKIAERLEKRVLEKHKSVRRWIKRLRKEKGVEKPKANVKPGTTILLKIQLKALKEYLGLYGNHMELH